MAELLPYRYREKLGRVVYCRKCRGLLTGGDPFVLRPVSRELVGVEHWPCCPRNVQNPRTVHAQPTASH